MNLAGYVAQAVYHNHARRFKTDPSVLAPSSVFSKLCSHNVSFGYLWSVTRTMGLTSLICLIRDLRT